MGSRHDDNISAWEDGVRYPDPNPVATEEEAAGHKPWCTCVRCCDMRERGLKGPVDDTGRVYPSRPIADP